MSDWFAQLKKAKKSCIVDGKLKRVHFDFGDGREMVEEYNLDTNVVTRRAWRHNKELKGEDKWEVEIGDPEPVYNKEETVLIRENSNQPFVSRRITRTNLEWRIRNLPYPIETYSVTAEPDSKNLVVRTANKKYFKKLPIPDLDRLNLLPEQENISFSHKFNTLIITYKKPKALVDLEKAVLQEINEIQPKNQDMMNCKPS
ncbi:protein DPCD [Anoplophora glabripennis]|nr:protein DPCD [Anoplophora glabripennis]